MISHKLGRERCMSEGQIEELYMCVAEICLLLSHL